MNPPPISTKPGDTVYVRARVLRVEDGAAFLPAGLLQVQPIDAGNNPIKDGVLSYFLPEQVITSSEMNRLLNEKWTRK